MESNFECAECGATFENKASLGNHTRNHKSFSCPEASCEYVAKRIDQLKAHIASKHPGIEYSVEAKARKRKSDESSVSESCHAQSSTAPELGSLLSPLDEGTATSKRFKVEAAEVSSDNNVINSFIYDTSLLNLLQGPSEVHPIEQPQTSSGLVEQPHLTTLRPVQLPQSVISFVKPSGMLASRYLNEENFPFDDRVAPAQGKSTRSLVEEIEALGGQINVLTDHRNRLISELSSKALTNDGYGY
ncbi:hypothetical protein AAVH_13208 [Aphelenchoides avenae]|nr:hypothetical protein AAVH_13208 [Aphelenchus avenae]